jgi:hypothetical protein
MLSALIGPYLAPTIISVSGGLLLISAAVIVERPSFAIGVVMLALGAAGVYLGLLVMNA